MVCARLWVLLVRLAAGDLVDLHHELVSILAYSHFQNVGPRTGPSSTREAERFLYNASQLSLMDSHTAAEQRPKLFAEKITATWLGEFNRRGVTLRSISKQQAQGNEAHIDGPDAEAEGVRRDHWNLYVHATQDYVKLAMAEVQTLGSAWHAPEEDDPDQRSELAILHPIKPVWPLVAMTRLTELVRGARDAPDLEGPWLQNTLMNIYRQLKYQDTYRSMPDSYPFHRLVAAQPSTPTTPDQPATQPSAVPSQSNSHVSRGAEASLARQRDGSSSAPVEAPNTENTAVEDDVEPMDLGSPQDTADDSLNPQQEDVDELAGDGGNDAQGDHEPMDQDAENDKNDGQKDVLGKDTGNDENELQSDLDAVGEEDNGDVLDDDSKSPACPAEGGGANGEAAGGLRRSIRNAGKPKPETGGQSSEPPGRRPGGRGKKNKNSNIRNGGRSSVEKSEGRVVLSLDVRPPPVYFQPALHPVGQPDPPQKGSARSSVSAFLISRANYSPFIYLAGWTHLGHFPCKDTCLRRSGILNSCG